MLQSIEPLLEKEQLDRVLVYGDTNSTLAGVIAASKMNIPVAHILPLHPRTYAAILQNGLKFSKVKIIEPVGYLDMTALECQAALIATDSGGVQKEAYFHGVPCVTLRDETELVEMGWNVFARPGSDDIASIIRQALGTRGRDGEPYGKGNASQKIAKVILNA